MEARTESKSSATVEKKLALIIRCHGSILVYEPKPDSKKTVVMADFQRYNIGNLSIIGLAKMGEVCYGMPNVLPFIKRVNEHYASEMDLKKTVDKKIQEVLIDARPPPKIQNLKNLLCGIDMGVCRVDLKQVDLTTEYVEKIYNKYDESSGVFMLFNSGFTPRELDRIREILKQINATLLTEPYIYRSFIFDMLKEFNISKLFFCDFTCNSYTPHGFDGLLQSEADEITELLVSKNVRGGKKKKNKTKKRKSQKNKNKK